MGAWRRAGVRGAEVAKLVRDLACDELHKWCAVGVSISTDHTGVDEVGVSPRSLRWRGERTGSGSDEGAG